MKSTTTLKATFLAAAATVSFATMNAQAADWIIESGDVYLYKTTSVYDSVVIGQGSDDSAAAKLIIHYNSEEGEGGDLVSREGFIGNHTGLFNAPIDGRAQGWVGVYEGMRWENYGTIYVGYKGYGCLDIFDGTVKTNDLYIVKGIPPFAPPSEVFVRETGNLEIQNNLYVGDYAPGYLYVEGGSVTVENDLSAGSTLNPGVFQITGGGTIQVGGDVHITNYMALWLELSDAFAPHITIGGSVVFENGSTLPTIEVLNEEIIAHGKTFTIIESISGLDDLNYEDFGTEFVNSPFTGQDFLLGGDGCRTVTLTALPVPEPSTYALLGGAGAVALAVLRRRRRKG